MKSEIVPLCVPSWQERDALEAGAGYSPERGFFTTNPPSDELWPWLPRRWRQPDRPALWPEMLPSTTWEENLRTALPADRWDALRRYAYRAAGNRCEICGDRGAPRLEAHEKWAWDDFWCVQKLTGIVAVCPVCHLAHHIGRARRVGRFPEVLSKFREVNGWSNDRVEQEIARARQIADERSRYGWTVDLSWLTSSDYNLVYQLN